MNERLIEDTRNILSGELRNLKVNLEKAKALRDEAESKYGPHAHRTQEAERKVDRIEEEVAWRENKLRDLDPPKG